MNAYEQKQEARRERLTAAAEAAAAESAARFAAADRIARVVDGQPILIGHHSEGHARADARRIDNHMRKGIEADNQTKRLARAAQAVGTGGISSDDPDAVTKLRDELAQAEALQAKMVAVNKAIRSKDPRATLSGLGYSDEQITTYLTPDRWQGYIGYPSYRLSNNNANIRRIKARIAELEELHARQQAAADSGAAPTETVIGGVTITEDVADNRILLQFAKMNGARDICRRYGFVWSPSRTAWVRKLHNGARYAAECAARDIAKL